MQMIREERQRAERAERSVSERQAVQSSWDQQLTHKDAAAAEQVFHHNWSGLTFYWSDECCFSWWLRMQQLLITMPNVLRTSQVAGAKRSACTG